METEDGVWQERGRTVLFLIRHDVICVVQLVQLVAALNKSRLLSLQQLDQAFDI